MALVTKCPKCKTSNQFINQAYYSCFQIWTCSVCNQPVYFITNRADIARVTINEVTDMYPKIIPELDNSIPEKIRKDMMEAYICFDNKCFKASVTMARRALQNAIRGKGAKGKALYDEINDLADKHIITPDLKDWAHEIRELGKIGAHPDDDGLDEILEKDAKEILNFAEEFLKYTYTMPAQITERRAKKKVAVE